MKLTRLSFLLSIIGISVGTTLAGKAYAAPVAPGDFLVDTAKVKADTLLEANRRTLMGDYTSILPFHETYLSWDTTIIHPYKFDMPHMKDTVFLVLADAHDCGYVPPVSGSVTSKFGPRSRTRYHYGIDLKLNVGDTVQSAFDGIVRISHYSPSYGNCVVIRHYNGLETLYGHLSWRNVKVGDVIKAGEMVGFGGNTGRSSGPHLHFEVRYKGQALDPNEIFTFNDNSYQLRSDTLQIDASSFRYAARFRNAAANYKSHARHTHGAAAGRSSAVYTIRKGDNLGVIALRHRTTVAKLCSLNGLSRTSTLQPGRKIRIR